MAQTAVEIRERREQEIQDKEASIIEEQATSVAVLTGEPVDLVARADEWQEWFSVQARIYRLEERIGDLPIAEEMAKFFFRGNMRGASIRLGKAEETNDVKPVQTTFKEGVELVKRLSGARVTPIVTHPDGSWERGAYSFESEEGKGLIFIDEETADNEVFRKLNKGEAFTPAETAKLDQLKAEVTEGARSEFYGDEKSLTPIKEIIMVPESVQEIKVLPETVDLEKELQNVSRRGVRYTLTAFIYEKHTQINKPAEQINNSQDFFTLKDDPNFSLKR